MDVCVLEIGNMFFHPIGRQIICRPSIAYKSFVFLICGVLCPCTGIWACNRRYSRSCRCTADQGARKMEADGCGPNWASSSRHLFLDCTITRDRFIRSGTSSIWAGSGIRRRNWPVQEQRISSLRPSCIGPADRSLGNAEGNITAASLGTSGCHILANATLILNRVF